MKTIKLLSPAKINLYLEIVGVREDGYHLIRSVMQPVDLFDGVKIDIADGTGVELAVYGCKCLANVNDNVMIKAAEAYLKYTGIESKINIGLKKKIPVEAGLGGGSSNAGATLYGLNKIFKRLDNDELTNIGKQIGSDVPFFINCRTAFVQGIGDDIKILNSFPLLNYIIIKPDFGLSTKMVYEKWDSMFSGKNKKYKNIDIDYYTERFKNSNLLLYNELENPAILINSKIKEIKDLLFNLGCANVSMTGSGSAIFAIFSDISQAENIFQYLSNSYKYKVFLCKGIAGWHRF